MEMVLIKDTKKIGFEMSPKRVRVMFRGQIIADSNKVRLLLPGGPPYYYFPKEDVRMEMLQPTERVEDVDTLGRASFWNVKVGDRTAENAAWTYTQPVSENIDLSRLMGFKVVEEA